MDADGGDGHGDGGGGGERRVVVMKKGPWTAAEDAVLIEFVSKHGEGNWNGVTRNSGLKRCGKSCRLRWVNYLRPNLKKCAFTHEEERVIIQLHAKFGNKWARMASQLQGRTDNEIKNYWNTRTKRRQRASLPIHPQETQRKVGGFHLQQQQKHKQDRHHRQGLEQQHQPHSSSCSIASLLPSSATGHSCQNSAYNRRRFSLFESIRTSSPPNPIQTHPSSSFFPNPNRQFNFFPSTYNNGFVLPLSPVSPVSSKSPISLSPSSFNQSFTSLLQPAAAPPLPPPPLHINPHNVEFNSSNTSMRDQFEPTELTRLLEMELPSSQTPMQPLTPASSATSGPPVDTRKICI